MDNNYKSKQNKASANKVYNGGAHKNSQPQIKPLKRRNTQSQAMPNKAVYNNYNAQANRQTPSVANKPIQDNIPQQFKQNILNYNVPRQFNQNNLNNNVPRQFNQNKLNHNAPQQFNQNNLNHNVPKQFNQNSFSKSAGFMPNNMEYKPNLNENKNADHKKLNNKKTSKALKYKRSKKPRYFKWHKDQKSNIFNGINLFIAKQNKLILIVCLLLFVLSSYKLINYALDAIRQSKALNEAREMYVQNDVQTSLAPSQDPKPSQKPQKAVKATSTTQPKATSEPQATKSARSIAEKYPNNYFNMVNSKFFKLLDTNKDVVGWIKMGDYLDQPVVKRDNKYYLTRNYKKEANPAGAIFIDEKCNLNIPPDNLLFHGHNMKNGSMFGKLMHFKLSRGVSYFLDNAIFEFDSLYQDSKYVIFAVFEIETDGKSPNYFPFMAYTKFETDQAAENFIKSVKSRSLYDVPISIEPSDSLATLATCSRTSDTSRLIIVARRIRDGENMSLLKDDIFRTSRIR